MPVDTRDKRSSAINIASPWRGQYPLADGAIGAADRAHADLYYTGIAAASPTAFVPDEEGFVLTKRDGVDYGVQWNHALPSVVHFYSPSATDGVWTNMPAAATEMDTRVRVYQQMGGVRGVRMLIGVTVIGAAGATLGVQYSLNDGSSWSSTVATASLAATGAISGTWIEWPEAGRTDVLLRVVGVDGDGAADPAWAYIVLECGTRLED